MPASWARMPVSGHRPFTRNEHDGRMSSGSTDAEHPLRAGRRAPPARTLVDIFRATAVPAPDALAVDSGAETLTYAELDEAAVELAGRLAEAGVGRGRQGRASGSSPAPPTSTSRSSASWWRARPTSRSTPTTPTSERGWSSTSRGRRPIVGNDLVVARRPVRRSRPGAGVAAPARTTPGSSSPPGRPARPRASPSPTATRPRSSTRRHGCSSRPTRSAPATG